ncbi:MAG TPA: pyruvate formate-lyase-activating protein [Syntrophomonadaceae bacterium]|nr:pyruvate formate-lyase-activating protein [Syntrophomonadaceae bacterium]
MQTEAYIHSIETLGTLDGPGIRYVIFFQGCAMRCIFCHNPDTWQMGSGKTINVDWLVDDIKKYLPYIKPSGGGVTVSGGEPLLQSDFLEVLFRRLDRLQIHKAIDTSGFVEVERVKGLLRWTDLILLSIKSAQTQCYRQLTGQSSDRTFRFARYLTKINKPVWIRYVIIPGITDSLPDLEALADLVSTMPNVQKIELLPYNDLGVYKWADLGMTYSIPDAKPPSEQDMISIRAILASLLPSKEIT